MCEAVKKGFELLSSMPLNEDLLCYGLVMEVGHTMLYKGSRVLGEDLVKCVRWGGMDFVFNQSQMGEKTTDP